MKVTTKYLYCPQCKEYPHDIIEEYRSPIREKRSWDGDYYELMGSNIDSVEFKQLCGVCETKLEER